MKKGAMFGLDARIALAIFGALSVISGAALYSAIQHSKVIAAVATLNEITKAMESYFLDIGEDMGYSTTFAGLHLDVEELVSSTKLGWKGPYLPYAVTNDAILKEPVYNGVSILKLRSIDWVFPVALGAYNCTTEVDCFYWAVLDNASNGLADAIDGYIDGAKDRHKGKIRLVYPSNDNTSTYSHVFMQGPPILK